MASDELVQLQYQPDNLRYLIKSSDIEELLADYASTHKLSEASRKEFERFVWQFLGFVKDGRVVFGGKIKAPQDNEEYVISREVLIGYVNALMETGYSNSSIVKRLQAVILVLRRLGAQEVLIDVLRAPLRRANEGRKKEQEANTPTLQLEDAREFFRRLELLFQLRRLPMKRYIKAIVFALLLFSTGRRVSEIAQLRMSDIDFETHSIIFSANQTKEGKLRGVKSGVTIAFMTQEAEKALRFYIENNRDEILKQDGYLFIKPGKKSLKDTFLHKIIQMSREIGDPEVNLNFVVSDGIHRFNLKFFRKLFIQIWERQAEKEGIFNDRVLAVARKITGHRPSNDVHRTNYAKISPQEMWEYYRELYYDISVLTPSQREMLGIIEENKKEKESKEGHHNLTKLWIEQPWGWRLRRLSDLLQSYQLQAYQQLRYSYLRYSYLRP
ncbi:MAG: hypothetical protein PWP49_135 [Thermococcaceae archaeon]|jgi:integrase|uniref:tyrosine-type recombinase/integrase n=1 Tax=Thermococcus sp. PK TaxID=913025 RepID=UPI000A80D59A|nr:site-specific integrase [Thermococcus sp. PK]MDK2853185.1 hypothetical protein [Thermococcaceae archaeon]MDN5319715.1 hypothetical protein [Thermococcaceae archaeon]HIH73368.1 site-specific integrase [Thermococcaceae archaeon]